MMFSIAIHLADSMKYLPVCNAFEYDTNATINISIDKKSSHECFIFFYIFEVEPSTFLEADVFDFIHFKYL